MNWWAWIASGAILLGAEIALFDAQFYLVFVGTTAILVGLVDLVVPGVPGFALWLAFAVLSVVSSVTFRKRLYLKLRGHAPAVEAGPAGHELDLPCALAPGETARIEHSGSHWSVQNDSPAALSAGDHVHVHRIEGLTLLVRPHPRA